MEKVKREISRAIIVGIAALLSMSLFACSKKENFNYVTFDENLPVNELIKQKQEVYKTMNENVTITPEEAARGKTIENTKRMVNEYGVTIYGKPISESEVISKGLNNEIGLKLDKKDGINVTYTEYYSDIQRSIIYLEINNKNGAKVYYDKDGVEIGTGSAASANVDIEKILANVKMGNAMAEAIDRSVNKNKQ